MGLLGMQFHLFENECESPPLRMQRLRPPAPASERPSSSSSRLPPRHHHRLALRLRQEAGVQLLRPERRGAPEIRGGPEGVDCGGVGDGADTHRV